MPVYSYKCDKCDGSFELFFSIREYQESPRCALCSSKNTTRQYIADAATINTSVKKSDSELKTIGDLANRNRDKLSQDEKEALFKKHNDYKLQESTKELPKGMSRIKKPTQKTKWRNK
jgi:putative FmdB family regulatory protein